MQSRRGFLGQVGAALGALGTMGFSDFATMTTVAPVPVVPVPVVPPMESHVPELWAKEALRTLEENMVMSSLVRRDFTDLPVCRDWVKCR